MKIKTTDDKWLAIEHAINFWLKDKTFYCGNCGTKWDAGKHMVQSCCDNPQFGRNKDHLKATIKYNKELRKIARKHGEFKDKSARLGISLPPNLYNFLENYCMMHNDVLFKTKADMHKFMRKFPALTIPEKV